MPNKLDWERAKQQERVKYAKRVEPATAEYRRNLYESATRIVQQSDTEGSDR